MSSESIRLPCIGLAALVVAAVAPAANAQGPSCLAPKSPPRGQRVWGGEIREVFALTDPVTSRKLVWTAEEGGRVNRSINGGLTWSYARTPATARGALLDVHFRDPREGWAVGVDGAVIQSTDSGANWTHVTLAAGTGCTLHAAASNGVLWAVHFVDANRGWIGGEHVFLYTTDGGATWCPVSTWRSGTQTSSDGYEVYAFDFVVDPSNPSVLRGLAVIEKTSASDAIVLSTDDGVNWHEELVYNGTNATPPADFEAWDVEFDPAATSVSSATAYLVGGVGSGGRFYASTDSGDTWTRETAVAPSGVADCSTVTYPPPALPPTFPCHDQILAGVNQQYGVAALSSTEAISVGYGGQRFRRAWTGSAYKWEQKTDRCEFTMPLNGAAAIDAGIAWVVGTSGYLHRTDDGGQTYVDQRPTVGSGARIFDLAFSSDLEGWIVGSESFVLHTTDGGCSWSFENNEFCDTPSMPSVVLKQVAAMESSGGRHAVASGGDGWLYWRTGTSSSTSGWGRQQYGTGVVFRDLDGAEGASSQTFWAVADGGVVIRTTDRGVSWSAVSNVPAGVSFTGVAMVSVDEGFLVGKDSSGAGVFYTVTSATTAPAFAPHSTGSTLPSLNAVAADGSALASGRAVAVGDSGVVVAWSGSALAAVSGVSGVATTSPLLSVGLTPGSATVLAGGEAGFELSFPYSGGSYTTPKSQTSKTIFGFALRSSSLGYLVSEGQDDSGSGTSQGDSTVLAIY